MGDKQGDGEGRRGARRVRGGKRGQWKGRKAVRVTLEREESNDVRGKGWREGISRGGETIQ